MKNNNLAVAKIILAYLVVYIVWGSTFFFIEKALHAFPTFILGATRFVIAGALLMGYCAIKGYKLFNKKDIKKAVFIGFLLLFVDMAAIIWAEQYISSAIVSILSAATAIWFIVLDKPKWKQNFTSAPVLIGLVTGFLGVMMLFGEQLFTQQVSETEKSQNLIAMIVLTLGTIGWTLGSLYSKYSEKPSKSPKSKEESLNVIVKTAWQMITAGTAFTLTAAFTGQYNSFSYANVSLDDWGSMVYLIFMGSILAFSSYIWLLQVRPATEVSTYAYVNPIVALILADLFTDHKVTPLQIAGLAIVLLSVLLMNWNLYKNARPIKAIKHRKKLKRLKHMAPKSSIPRIMEVAGFEEKESQREKEL